MLANKLKIFETKTLNFKRQIFEEHFTAIEILKNFILSKIQNNLRSYKWVDLFCEESNLILPILIHFIQIFFEPALSIKN
jgi:hypothetical protein